jgi:hypothetical protein
LCSTLVAPRTPDRCSESCYGKSNEPPCAPMCHLCSPVGCRTMYSTAELAAFLRVSLGACRRFERDWRCRACGRTSCCLGGVEKCGIAGLKRWFSAACAAGSEEMRWRRFGESSCKGCALLKGCELECGRQRVRAWSPYSPVGKGGRSAGARSGVVESAGPESSNSDPIPRRQSWIGNR